ncbi:MAG: hypothetical protein IPK63_18620 [Candidatus Competibacteraceae bacterium]|nr:hypothetical protein [Candidatus Competibacteraceae bacterium]
MSSNEMVIHQSAPLVPYQDMERMAAVIAQSGLFGVKNQNQAMALMLLAQAEGMHPATAARDYHVIQGKPALKRAARSRSSGRSKWQNGRTWRAKISGSNTPARCCGPG